MTRNHHIAYSHTILSYFYTYSKPCLIPYRTVRSNKHAHKHGHTHTQNQSHPVVRSVGLAHPPFLAEKKTSPNLACPRRTESCSCNTPRSQTLDLFVLLPHLHLDSPVFRIPGTSLNLSPRPPIRSSNEPSTSGRWTSFWCVVRSIHIPIRETILPASCDETRPRSRFSCCSCDFPRTERGGSTSP